MNVEAKLERALIERDRKFTLEQLHKVRKDIEKLTAHQRKLESELADLDRRLKASA